MLADILPKPAWRVRPLTSKLKGRGGLALDSQPPQEAVTMVRKRTGSLLGAVYVLIGATLLGSALFAPWYYYDSYSEQHWGTPGGPNSEAVGPSELSFFLFGLPGSGSVQTTCPSGNVSNFCPTSSSYSHGGLNSTGQVATLILALATAGFAVAAIGGVLGVIWRGKARTMFPELILAVVAVALAIAATAAFAVLLPGAFAHDISASQRGYETIGPWSSFSGSTTFTTIPISCPSIGCSAFTASWGPSIGWCFSVAAIMFLLVGVVMMVRFRHDVAETAPSTVSPAPTHGSNPRNPAR